MYFYRYTTTTALEYVLKCSKFNYLNDPVEHRDYHEFGKDGIYCQPYIPKVSYGIDASLTKRNGVQGLPLLIRFKKELYKTKYSFSEKNKASIFSTINVMKAAFIRGGVNYQDVEISLDKKKWFALSKLDVQLLNDIHKSCKATLNKLTEEDYNKYYIGICSGSFVDSLHFQSGGGKNLLKNNNKSFMVFGDGNHGPIGIQCVTKKGEYIEAKFNNDSLTEDNNPGLIPLIENSKTKDGAFKLVRYLCKIVPNQENCLKQIGLYLEPVLGYNDERNRINKKFESLIEIFNDRMSLKIIVTVSPITCSK